MCRLFTAMGLGCATVFVGTVESPCIEWAPKDALHNSLRTVAARSRAVYCVAFLANSPSYWLQKAPCSPPVDASRKLTSKPM
jgi:hypothetical protein